MHFKVKKYNVEINNPDMSILCKVYKYSMLINNGRNIYPVHTVPCKQTIGRTHTGRI